MQLKRRQFLGYGASLLATTSFNSFASNAEAALSGQILGVTTLNPKDHGEQLSSVVSIDLRTGDVGYTALPDHELGHSLLALPDGGFFAVPYGNDEMPCLFLNADLSVRTTFSAPADHGFGGHAALLPDGETIVGHFNHSGYALDKRTPDQTGRLFVLDVASGEVRHSQETNILHGHDMIVTRDGASIIVSDDGTTEVRAPEDPRPEGDPFALVAHSPSLSVFDANTFALKKQIPLDINGSLVHIEQGHDGRIFGSAEQYVTRDEAGFAALKALLGEDGDIDAFVNWLEEDDYELELPYPGPLVRVNLADGDVARHMAPYNQAPFDIKINEATGRVFNVFTASGLLARFEPVTGRWGYFSSREYGIEQPYGLVDIPGTTMMAVNDFLNGIAIFDVISMSLVKFITTENHGIKHLLYQRA